jgi:hypothetical protein
MSRVIKLEDAQSGEVVINFCDPEFVHDTASSTYQNWDDHLIRLLAYTLFAKRVIIPGRYLLRNSPLFSMVSKMPKLLKEDVIVPDCEEAFSSFEEREVKNNRPKRDLECAKFLDKHASRAEFDGKNQGTVYHSTLLDDLEPNGALGRCFRLKYHNKLSEISSIYSQTFDSPEHRNEFIQVATKLMPKHSKLWKQWAAVRYYTTPFSFDSVRLRDLPQTAIRLLQKSGSLDNLFGTGPAVSSDLPDPMARIADYTRIFVPPPRSEKDLRKLEDVILAVRHDVPQACGKFADIISIAQAKDLSGTINEKLKSEFLKEPFLSNVSLPMKKQIIKASKDALPSALIGVATSALGPLAPVIDYTRNIYSRVNESEKTKKRAPFTVCTTHYRDKLKEKFPEKSSL